LIWRAKQEWARSNASEATRILDDCRWDLRAWEWHYLERLCHTELRSYPSRGAIRSLAVSRDGLHIAAAGGAGSRPASLPMAIGPDGGLLGAGIVANRKPGFLEVRNAQTGALERWWGGINAEVRDVCFSGDGRRIAAAYPSKDGVHGMVSVVDAANGQQIASVTGPFRRIAFGPEGVLLALGNPKGILLWDILLKRAIGAVANFEALAEPIQISPDGRRLACAVSGPIDKPWDVLVWRMDDSVIAPWMPVLGAPMQGLAPMLGYVAMADQLCRPQPPLRLQGHRSEVTCIAFSMDHTRLATCSRDRTIKIWDVESGRELWTLSGHQHSVLGVAFSRDGGRLASVSGNLDLETVPGDGEIKIWDMKSGQEVRTIRGTAGRFLSVAWSADGNQVITGDMDGNLKYWDALADQENRVLDAGANEIFFIALSPDGKHLAASAFTRGVAAPGKGDLVNTQIKNYADIKIWELPSFKEEASFRLVSGSVRDLAFTPDGKRLYISKFDAAEVGTGDTVHKDAPGLVVWDLAAGKRLEPSEIEARLTGIYLSCSPDGTRLASNQELLDAKTGRVMKEFKGNTPVSFSPNSRFLAIQSEDTIALLDARDGTEIKTLKCKRNVQLFRVKFNPNSTMLAVSSDVGPKVWNIETGSEAIVIPASKENQCWDIDFSRDGKRLLAAQDNGKVAIWDLATGQAVVELRGSLDPVRAMTFSPDGNQLFTAGFDKKVHVWNAEPLRIADSLHTVPNEAQTMRVNSGIGAPVVFGVDDRFILGPSEDLGAILWNAKTGRRDYVFDEALPRTIEIYAFDKAGTRFATAAQERRVTPLLTREQMTKRLGNLDLGPFSKDVIHLGMDQVIRVRDAKTLKETLTLKAEGSMLLSLAFSPDGSRLAGVSKNDVRVWDLENGKEVFTLPGSTQEASAVCYSPDGQWIATGTWQDVRTLDKPGEVRLWNAATGKEAHALKEHNGGRVVSLAFSPDGKWLAAATGKVSAQGAGVQSEVEIWEVSGGKVVSRFGQNAGIISCLAFHPDGSELATGSFDGMVRIWEPAGGKLLGNIVGHSGAVSGLAYSRDGARLASVSASLTYICNIGDWKLKK
jgi:WD40 repeat protein